MCSSRHAHTSSADALIYRSRDGGRPRSAIARESSAFFSGSSVNHALAPALSFQSSPTPPSSKGNNQTRKREKEKREKKIQNVYKKTGRKARDKKVVCVQHLVAGGWSVRSCFFDRDSTFDRPRTPESKFELVCRWSRFDYLVLSDLRNLVERFSIQVSSFNNNSR